MAKAETSHTESFESLANIGPTTARWLRDVEVETPDALARIGSAEAYRRLQLGFPRSGALDGP